jgi:glycosyltransferase involved in cell wall biosynthesis
VGVAGLSTAVCTPTVTVTRTVTIDCRPNDRARHGRPTTSAPGARYHPAMRAVHVVTRLNVGGVARFLEVAHDAVDVLVRGRVQGEETEASWDGPQVVLPSLGRAVHPLHDGRALAELTARLRRLRPGVVHTHASKAGAIGRLAAHALRLPVVHTFHGHVLDGYFPRPVAWVLERLERRLARRGLVTATGPATARDLARRLGVPVEVVPPGVRLPAPTPGARERWRASFGDPERVALAVGRAAAVKDHARFVRAARAAGYLPVVAGAARVPGALALGPVARMQDLYAACDVVVSASRREGTPFALLEAAWCGRPVVATPVGDVAWVVGRGGIVTDDLEAGLARLRDPGLRADLGAAAARDVRARFPDDAVAPRLRDLYARVA